MFIDVTLLPSIDAYTTVHCGTSEGLSSAPYWTVKAGSYGGTGDVNNDGNLDLLLGGQLYYGPLPEGTTELGACNVDISDEYNDDDNSEYNDDNQGDDDGGDGGGCFISNLF